MTDILELLDISIDLYDGKTGTVHYCVTAMVDDMVEKYPARYHPAALAEPAEYAPAQCSASFTVANGEEQPDIDLEKARSYIESLDLDWQVDDPD